VSPPTQSAPAGAVQSPLAQVIAMSELEVGRSGEADAGHYPGARMPALVDVLSNVQHPLRRVKAKLTVCVGTVELSIGELLGAQEQHVLRLDRSIEQPVDVLLEGQVVARGTLVAVDDHFAVRITELPVSFDAAANPACTT
jgi:flagellar motor switch protein FliN/FliY